MTSIWKKCCTYHRSLRKGKWKQWDPITHLLKWPKSKIHNIQWKQGWEAIRTLTHYWWEYKMIWPLWKGVFTVSYKTRYTSPYNPVINHTTYLPKRTENVCSHKNLPTEVYSSFILKYQNLKATKMFFSTWSTCLWDIQTKDTQH
jgi:hypothetical protein